MFMKKLQCLFAKDDEGAGGSGEEDEIEELEDTGAEPEEEGESEEGTEGEGESEGSEEETEGESGDESAGATPAAASQGRRDKRIASALDRAKKAEERAIRAETLAEERARAPQQPAVNSAEAARLRAEKLELMTPDERRGFEQDEKLQRMEQQVLLTQLTTKDMLDKSAYQNRAASNPVWAKHAQAVEARLHASRQKGIDYPREMILAQIVGEAALKAQPKKGEKDAARERVNSVKGKPASVKTNSGAYRPGKGKESLEDLESRIGDVSF